MFSEYSSSSLCFMGISSNSKVFVFLSDKDMKGINNIEGCQTIIQEDHHQLNRLQQLSVHERDQEDGDSDHQNQQPNNMVVTKRACPINLKLEIPSSYVGSEKDDDDSSDDGFKTPTSSDYRVPVFLECPGAPKKTKTMPATKKRKACPPRIFLDLSKDLEPLFPMPYLVDLAGAVVNKRVKQCSGMD